MAEQMGRNGSLSRKLLLAAMESVAVVAPLAVGWGQAQGGTAMLIHPKDGVRHAFEVATIKPSPDTALGVRIMLSPANFSARDMSVSDIIKFAYGIKSDDQLVGAPNWVKTEHFDIQGKASEADIAAYHKLGFDEGINVPRLLLQSLLEDRFQLKAKVETRDMPVYALVVDKSGIKMKEVTPDPFPPPGVAPAPCAHLPRFMRSGPNEYSASAWNMPRFAETLSHSPEVGNRPVLDETGLTGNYDFVLSGIAIGAPFGDANASGTQTAEISLFAALPEQLGLKLIPVKAPMEVLVIESIEPPSAN